MQSTPAIDPGAGFNLMGDNSAPVDAYKSPGRPNPMFLPGDPIRPVPGLDDPDVPACMITWSGKTSSPRPGMRRMSASIPCAIYPISMRASNSARRPSIASRDGWTYRSFPAQNSLVPVKTRFRYMAHARPRHGRMAPGTRSSRYRPPILARGGITGQSGAGCRRHLPPPGSPGKAAWPGAGRRANDCAALGSRRTATIPAGAGILTGPLRGRRLALDIR